MKNSEIWAALKVVSEIKSRIQIAQSDQNMKHFIKDFILENRDDKDVMWRFIFIIKNEYPAYAEFIDKILILL